jgi:GPI mannosyltransferase 3
LRKLRLLSRAGFLLVAIFLIALALRVEVAAHYPSIDWGDEIFNTLEPAHHLAYGYGIVVWEWREGIRSWVFPAFLAGVMRATDWMGRGSFGYLAAIRVVLSLISLATVWFGYVWGKRASGEAAAIIAAGACAFWYELVHFAPKALNDVLAGNLLLPGLYLGVYGEALPERKRLFFAGLFCGLAVSFRNQLAPAVLFAVLYFCRTNWRRKSLPTFLGLLLPIVAFGLVDAITWSYPFQSLIRYFRVVVIEGRSLMYGTEPWYWYVWMLALHFLPLFFLALVGIRRSPLLGWMAFIIVASHSVLAHKEYRFIYPVMPILLTLAALGFVELAEDFKTWGKPALSPKMITVAGLVLCVGTSALLAWKFPRSTSRPVVAVMDQLSLDPSVCGVGLYKIPWIMTGGYSHLHQNVPLVMVRQDSELQEQVPAFNALLSRETVNDQKMTFKSDKCWGDVCLYRRTGSCIMSPQTNEVNKMLRESGE